MKDFTLPEGSLRDMADRLGLTVKKDDESGKFFFECGGAIVGFACGIGEMRSWLNGAFAMRLAPSDLDRYTCGLFTTMDSPEEALKYVQELADASGNASAVMTAVGVAGNSIIADIQRKLGGDQ